MQEYEYNYGTHYKSADMDRKEIYIFLFTAY